MSLEQRDQQGQMGSQDAGGGWGRGMDESFNIIAWA